MKTVFNLNIFLQSLLFLIVLCLGLYAFPLALLGDNFDYVPGDLGDGRFINFVLEQGYQFLVGKQDSFYNAPFFFPATNTLALSDNMVGTLPIYAFFRALDYSRETAYQLWWASLFVLNFTFAYACYFSYSKNRYVALITAYIFTFGIIHFGQIGYNQLGIQFLLPLIFLRTIRLLEQTNYQNFLYLTIVMLFQLIMGVYYFFLAAFVIICLYASYCFLHKSQPILKELFSLAQRKKMIFLIICALVCVVIYMYPYVLISSQIPYHNFSQALKPGFLSYFLAHDASIWSWINGPAYKAFPDNWWMHSFFWGVFPMALFVGTLFFAIKSKTTYRYIAYAILLAILLSLSISGKYSLFILFYYLPGFNSLTVLVRVITVIFALVLFVNTHLISLLFLKYRQYSLLLFVFLLGLVLIDTHMDPQKMLRTEKRVIEQRYKRIDFFVKHTNKQNLAIVSEITDEKNFKFHIDAMLYAQMHGMKSINGYSSNSPSGYSDFWIHYNRETLQNWCLLKGIDSTSIFILDNPNPQSSSNIE